MIASNRRRERPGEEEIRMKKLMTIMLGLSLAIGCVSVSFAQDTTKKEKSKKPKKEKKKKEATKK